VHHLTTVYFRTGASRGEGFRYASNSRARKAELFREIAIFIVASPRRHYWRRESFPFDTIQPSYSARATLN